VVDVRKSFGAVTALDGASFELRPGELLALLGPNGAGKTTLIRAIAGRVRLDSGAIHVFGRPVTHGATSRELGIVPQEVALYSLLSGRENLEVFGRLLGLSGSELRAQIDWTLRCIGLADRADELVKGFSGGMKRRLNIGCGILHRPRVVLLDEPTVGVDPQSRDSIYEVLRELAAGGVSLLLTTHHLEEAEARCSRTVIIDHGRVIASGTLPELIDRTIGRHRIVTLRLDRPLSESQAALFSTGCEPLSGDGRAVRTRLDDVALELPRLLARVREAGCAVEDVDVRGPSLQAVFIHLTGRELREDN
jgi:ABC-2 type transport system ATP-binding protein